MKSVSCWFLFRIIIGGERGREVALPTREYFVSDSWWKTIFCIVDYMEYHPMDNSFLYFYGQLLLPGDAQISHGSLLLILIAGDAPTS